ncbi:DNA-binding protein [Pokkaliibacter plantistimulans]|uniref:DNA-binding protein n=1 Tax=Proteobacteria bacterium 228 TaxID=2083153 RepID=A0A2S5KTH9_9PROT|nr:PLP-dependent aminotransferase family protein [Pokkaliibacter plantistimulans]PPC77576.1 DNA-binding protein [Pokkaliibacter plantistimulans]
MIDITGTLDPAAKTPSGKRISLHKQLVDRLRDAILSGRLPSGATMTSSRALADELGISRNTVVLAYEHLAAEGYVIADQNGTRVADLTAWTENLNPDVAIEEKSNRIVDQRVEIADVSSRSVPSTDLLTPGIPSLSDFPLTSWRRSLERAVKQLNRHSLVNKDPLGEKQLRKAIAQHLNISRGVQCNADQIFITEGAQQALELCILLMTNPGDTVWVEDPCYYGVKSAFSSKELKILSIPVDKEGLIIPYELWATNLPKIIFTSPAHQYPTGAVLSVSRRLELLNQARKSGSWVIEDDYDADFRHFGSPIASMQGLSKCSPVFYIGSFSKSMYPTLRIGFMVIPERLKNEASLALSNLLKCSNQIQQMALADFIISGEFGRHLGRMRRVYRERQKVLRSSISQFFPESWILGGSAGMHLTLTLPVNFDDHSIAVKANSLGIGVLALSTFYSNRKPTDCGLVIGYGNTQKDSIPKAVSTLAELIKATPR